jgi:internalin A
MKERLQEFLQDLDIDKKKLLFILGGAVLAVLLLVIVLSTVLGGSGKKYDKLYREAEAAYQAQDYAAAEKALRSAMELKNTEQAYLLMADIYTAQGETEKAIEILYLGYSRVGGDAIGEKLETLKLAQSGGEAPAPAGPVTVAGMQVDGAATSLVLSGNGLSSADRAAIGTLTAMESLSINDCGVSDLSFLSGLSKLTLLQVSDNAVRDLSPLAALTKLKTLYIDNNPVKSLEPLYGLTSLRTLSMKGVDVSASELEALKEALPNCHIYADTPDAQETEITLGGRTFSTDVTELNLGGLGITDISALTACKDLEKLDLRDNKIEDISPLVELQSLKWLCIWNNEVEDIYPLLSLPELEYFDADGNKISDISVLQYLTKLDELWLNNNPIKSFEPIRGLTELTRLGLAGTGLDDDGLDCLMELTKLKELNIKRNEDLSAKKFEELRSVIPDCAISHDELRSTIKLGELEFDFDAEEITAVGQEISDLSPLAKCKNLRRLTLTDNKIKDLTPLRGLSTLEELCLDRNQIADLSPLAGCTRLKKLVLDGNDISDLTPLAACRQLETLSLGSNSIRDLRGISGLTDLHVLNLDNNQISDLSALYDLKGLEALILSNNGLTADDILALLTALPDCVVTHDVELTEADLEHRANRPASNSDLR